VREVEPKNAANRAGSINGSEVAAEGSTDGSEVAAEGSTDGSEVAAEGSMFSKTAEAAAACSDGFPARMDSTA
jgi:hypothetical protein